MSRAQTLEELDVRVVTVEGRVVTVEERVDQVERTAADNAEAVVAIRAELRASSALVSSTLWRAAAVVVAAEPIVRELADANGPVAVAVGVVVAIIALVLFRRNDPPPGSPNGSSVHT